MTGQDGREDLPGPSRITDMAKAPPRITLSASRDIPLDKLVLSQSNVRRVKAGVSIEELAEDIARRTLLQSLTVRAVRDAEGAETGMFEVPAGGRRFQALQLLVKQKRLAKTAPIPCVVREAGLAAEDSLAENIQRAPLHPLDQFRAFAALREKGRTEEEIAAAFFIAVTVVRQRLRLASVSPALLEVYAEDGLTLDQLMAFTVSTDHVRQKQVYERWKAGYTREPYAIRRMLTESAVRASDRRAQFVGLDDYIAAGGSVTRDLFQADDGGWLQDAALLDRLVATKLDAVVETVRAEGWRWIEAAIDLPYGHTYGLRQLRGEPVALTADEEAARDALRAEQEALERQFEDGSDLTEEADRRLGEIEDALAAYDERPLLFNPDEVGRAGAFVSLDAAGRLRIERGFVRPEDEVTINKPEQPGVLDETEREAEAPSLVSVLGDPASADATVTPEPEEDEGMRPLSDRLMTELTVHRTLALRHALGEQPEVALLAALHALCLKVFFRFAPETCLELDLKQAAFFRPASGSRRQRSRSRARSASPSLGRRSAARGEPALGCAAGLRPRQQGYAVRPLRRAVV